MNKYIKKQNIVEAYQVLKETEHFIKTWSKGNVYVSPVSEPTEDNPTGVYWQVTTDSGIATAIIGDWICLENNSYFVVTNENFQNEFQVIS